jgi:hypothetical protein
MRLVENWDQIIKSAWSVKFTAIAALLSGLEVAVQIIKPEGIPNPLFAVLAGLVSMAVIPARILAQREVKDVSNP